MRQELCCSDPPRALWGCPNGSAKQWGNRWGRGLPVMIPEELKGSELPLSKAERYPIVVITGNELRHHRFALRI